MNKLLPAVLLALALVAPAHADDTPPSDASLHELMALNQTEKLMDTVWKQVDAMTQKRLEQELAGRPVTPQQQAVLDEMRARMLDTFKRDMRWEVLEPKILDVYRRSFTQHEIDGMLAFYKSDAGRAVIAKMPLVMQNTMQMVSAQMAVLMPELQRIQQDAVAQLHGAPKAKADSGGGSLIVPEPPAPAPGN